MIYDDDNVLETPQSNFILRLINQIHKLFSLNEKDYEEISKGISERRPDKVSRTMLARTLRTERLKQRIADNTKRN